MKNFFYLLLAVLPLAIVSCGDEEDDDFILQSSFVEVVNGGATGQIQFTGSLPKVNVANSFIATVDERGRVTAKHAGHTVAYVGGKTVDIYVKGTNSLIGDICYEWGKGKQYIFSKTTFTDFQKSNSNTYDMYIGMKVYSNQPIVMYGYGFTKNQDKLETVSILVHKSYSSNLASFIKERFYMVEYTDVIGSMLTGMAGLDSDDQKSATSIVTIATTSEYPNYYMVMIMPYQPK